MGRRGLIAGVVVAVVGFGGWLYATPYLAVRNMQKAAEGRDPVTLTSYVNFPSLKESLKANFNAMLAVDAANSSQGNPFSTIGNMLAGAMINSMVDSLVTPEALTMMLRGDQPNVTLGKAQAKTSSKVNDRDVAVAMGYEDLDRFAVSFKAKDEDAPMTLILHREGMASWKLASLRLPPPPPKANPVAFERHPRQDSPHPMDLSKYVGQPSFAVLQDADLSQHFRNFLQGDFDRFSDRIGTSPPLTENGDYYYGEGCMPHQCGDEMAAFALHRNSGWVYAAILTGGNNMKIFGASSLLELPQEIRDFYARNGQRLGSGPH